MDLTRTILCKSSVIDLHCLDIRFSAQCLSLVTFRSAVPAHQRDAGRGIRMRVGGGRSTGRRRRGIHHRWRCCLLGGFSERHLPSGEKQIFVKLTGTAPAVFTRA